MQYRFGLEERYLSKSNALDEVPAQEQEHRVSAFGLWRPSNRLTLLVRMPYNVKEITTSPVGEATSTQRSRGFGDAEVLALFGLAHTAGPHALTLGLVLVGTAPTGSNDALDERLDSHLQPGAGAWSGTTGANVAITAAGGTLDASVLGRASTQSAHG